MCHALHGFIRFRIGRDLGHRPPGQVERFLAEHECLATERPDQREVAIDQLRLQLDRIEYWTSHGAQMSPTVKRLIKDFAAQQKAQASAGAAA